MVVGAIVVGLKILVLSNFVDVAIVVVIVSWRVVTTGNKFIWC